jgi:uncharacterized protein YukE
MADCEYKRLDTNSFDDFFSNKERLVQEYDEINSEYDRIVSTLLENWDGLGAAAFKKDASEIKTNITSIFDTLQSMFNVLTDCYTTFQECDTSLGKFNRDPTK